MIRRPPRSTLSSSSAASDVYKRQASRENDTAARTCWNHSRAVCKPARLKSLILRSLVILANHSPMNSNPHHMEFDNRRLGNVDQDVIAGAVKRPQPNSR